jgi:hypothetical protein
MRISERKLRSTIRAFLLEQVVGYQAPAKSYDDPMGDDDHDVSVPTTGISSSNSSSNASSNSSTSNNSDSVSSDGGGYVGVGDMGVDVSLTDDSQEKKKATGMQVRKLSQQRQKDLDSGSTTDAESSGEQLSMATRMRS